MPPDDDVVEHGGISCIEEMRVLRSAWSDFVEVVGERSLQAIESTFAFDPDGAQVRHVEHRRAIAASEVFGNGARRVSNGHLPATELDEIGVEGPVLFDEW